jgi:hypothetical protein
MVTLRLAACSSREQQKVVLRVDDMFRGETFQRESSLGVDLRTNQIYSAVAGRLMLRGALASMLPEGTIAAMLGQVIAGWISPSRALEALEVLSHGDHRNCAPDNLQADV